MNKIICSLVVFVLACPGFAFCYDVVLKNGKTVSGILVSEDDEKISIKDAAGLLLNFKKSSIDLEKTALLNKPVDQPAVTKEPEKPVEAVEPRQPKKPAKVYSAEDLYRLRGEYPMDSGAGVEFEEGENPGPRTERTGEEWQQLTQELLAGVKAAEQDYQQLTAKCKEFQSATIQTHVAISAEGQPTDLVKAKETACQNAEDAKTALDRVRQEYESAVAEAREANVPRGYIATDEE